MGTVTIFPAKTKNPGADVGVGINGVGYWFVMELTNDI